MIDRRKFTGLLTAGAGLVAMPAYLKGAGRDVVRLGNGAGVIDANLIFYIAGQNKRLRYFEEENVDLEITTLSGNAENIRMVAAGHVDTASFTPLSFIQLSAKTPNLDLICAYCWARSPYWMISVKPDSPYKSIGDLKGKRIGIRNQGDTGYDGARMMCADFKLDPEKDMEWVAVGDSGPGGDALYRDRVDALAYMDTNTARTVIAGYKLRTLPNSPGMQRLIGATWGVKKSTLQANKDKYIRFFRAMAKSTVFAQQNPEIAVQMLWEDYPETRPKGKSAAEAMQDALLILALRKTIWTAMPWQEDKRVGAMRKEEWDAQVEYIGYRDKVGDVTGMFTTELIEGVNKFDRAAIVETAKTIKL